MTKKPMKMLQKGVVFLFGLALLVGVTLPVAAADGNVPTVVLDARSAVVRIVSEGEDFIASGTGFAVGSEKHPYIITNYHVVEDHTALYLYYDTGKYVEGRVYKEYPDQDLAVIRPKEAIPGLTVLTLAGRDVDSGLAVYALGFPGASDILSEGFEGYEYDTVEEFLDSVVADKQSMTITNGIISAIRTSKLIGYSGKDVKMVQTNTAINNGNSGGPLLNSAGEVVGINTIGLSGIDSIEAMNGSVHVEELIRLLKRDGVPYATATKGGGTATADATGGKSRLDPVKVAAVSGGLLVFVAAILVIVVVVRRGRKPSLKKEMNMLAWERGGFTLSEPEVQAKTMVLLRELAGLQAAGSDVYALLRPENVLIGPKGIVLNSKKGGESDSGALKLYPGYSAPESYDNRSGGQSAVYAVGALMALLLTGRRPENAMRRKETGEPAFPGQNLSTMRQIVNEAMEVREEKRPQGLGGLQYRLSYALPAIQYENSGQAGGMPPQNQPLPPGYPR